MSRQGWKLLTHANLVADLNWAGIADRKPDKRICLIRKGNGRCMTGEIREVNRLAMEIENGEIKYVVPFSNELMMYQMLEPPSERSWTKAETQFQLPV